jgi:hypothetical protein
MDKKTVIIFLAGVVAGIVFSPQIAKVPGLSKIPRV